MDATRTTTEIEALAAALIEESQGHSEIVWADLPGRDTVALERVLEGEAEGSVEVGYVTEYWGEDWRVHVRHASAAYAAEFPA